MKKTSLIIAAALILSGLTLNAQEMKVDTKKSTIHWLGKKVGGQHDGYIKLKSGFLEVDGKEIKGGEIVVDMNSITNEDIKKEQSRERLVGHLKSDDFFGVEKYPTARLVITKGAEFKDGKAELTGMLSIKDKTEPLSFTATMSEGSYSTTVEIDRSKFDVRYGSPTFFNDLGNNAINDIFTLDISLVLK